MSGDRHARVKACFLAAADLPEAERAAYVARLRAEDPDLCDEVCGMLAFDGRAPQFLAHVSSLPAHAATPAAIGPFRVLRLIGAGGMGTVYEAEQEHPHRRVALKVLDTGLLSPSFVRRFEFEGELLARLSHPGIAHVFQTGTAPGAFGPQPYIAMELVAGLPLMRHATERGLDRSSRIELLVRIADAVEHAHRRGVIHRDLKPGNILVDAEGWPKVLDFGIGRVIDHQGRERTLATEAGQILGTLQYMSPEQALGAGEGIDARADVYALGVLLYELLCDHVPYETAKMPLHEALQTVIAAEPLRLSERDRTLGGDLETISSKALEKQPQRRYGSAGELADDLRRHLAHEPIHAQAPTTLYRFKKFARRNRALVAGIAATFAALVLGLAGTTWQAFRASAREHEAREAADTAQSILQHLLLDGIAALDPRELGPNVSAASVFGRVDQHLEDKFADRPAVEAAVRDALGSIWRSLGDPARAEPLLVRALELRKKLLGIDDPRTLDTMEHLSSCLLDRGRYAEALALIEDVHARRRAILGERDPATLVALNDLGVALWNNGRAEESIARLREAVRLRELSLGETHDKTLSSKNNLGTCLSAFGKIDEARAILEGALAARRRVLDDAHPDVLLLRSNLARCLESQGTLEDPEATWRALAADYEKTYGPDHPQTAVPLQGLAVVLAAKGQAEEAEGLYRRALLMLTKAYGDTHIDVFAAQNELARFLERNGKVPEALALCEAQVAALRKMWPAGHARLAIGLNYYGQVLRRSGRHDEAIATFESAIAMARASKDIPSDVLSQCLYNLGVLLRVERKKHAEAVPFLAEALELDRAVYPEGNDTIAGDLFHLGSALLDAGEPAKAEPHFQALVEPPYDLGPDHNRTPGRLRMYGSCLFALGRRDEALQQLDRAVECAEKVFGPEDRRTSPIREERERVRSAGAKPGQ